MNELEKLKKLSETEIGTKQWNQLFNDLIGGESSYHAKNKFRREIERIERNRKSQEEYINKYKHLEILQYDVETFMPIYKGVKKWSEQ